MESQSISSGLIFFAFLLTSLVLIPEGSRAAKIDFDDPQTITNGYTIIEYKRKNKTQLGIDFTDTKGISLSMDYSTLSMGHSITVDEYFVFKLQNSTGKIVDKVSIGFAKSAGAALINKPSPLGWALSLVDKWSLLDIDRPNIDIVETDSSVNVEIPFLKGGEWMPDQTIYLFRNWDLFNAPRADWLLSIDLNENDFSSSLTVLSTAIPTPIPGAIWGLGSGLAWLWAMQVVRRKKVTSEQLFQDLNSVQ